MFQETEPSHISGNGKPRKLLILQEVTFRARKMKKKKHSEETSGIWKFPEMEKFLALSLKNFLYFRRKLAKPENQKWSFCSYSNWPTITTTCFFA